MTVEADRFLANPAPRLLVEVRPSYTAEAMRNKVQGMVVLEVVVQQDCTPGAIRVVRSPRASGASSPERSVAWQATFL